MMTMMEAYKNGCEKQDGTATNAVAAANNDAMQTRGENVFWRQYVYHMENQLLAYCLNRSTASDSDKNTLCALCKVILREDAGKFHAHEAPLDELEVLVSAVAELNIPYWYARWWYLDMAQNGWRTSLGIHVDARTWRSLIRSWWAHTHQGMKELRSKEYSVSPAAVSEAIRSGV